MEQHSIEGDQCINECHAVENKGSNSGENGHTRYWLIQLIFIYSHEGTFQCASITDKFGSRKLMKFWKFVQ